ncbi:transketolase family protein [Marinobacter confluentis]|uniref:Transketolase n=1 Tax=Marinobacter confluentis TaxID=1697557 RepID=A0A4Z1BCM7_9GAMM|nr:transketolase [Marinobacter confluentis]TGN39964.1 transketolase [Marinobacter confluentis]
MRDAFIDELIQLARINPQIALVVGDLGYGVVEPFAEEFPDRFINAGVAEQNMTGLAAGMASEGYHVFTYSIANFPSFRCAEQIRNDVDYHNLSVTVVAVGGGLAYGALGYSHHAIQDYGLFRCLPNMLIAAPGDPLEVRACLRYLIENPQPSYLRLGKAGERSFHEKVPDVVPGKWLHVAGALESGRNVLLSTGATLAIAMDRWQASTDPDFSVNSLPLWGMAAKPMQNEQIADCSAVNTIEDHLYDCGFGSWLLEAASCHSGLTGRIIVEALNREVCGSVGSQNALNILGGIGPK